MKDLEIWKIKDTGFNSTGILVSSHGRFKRFDWKDRVGSDNGFGYKNINIYNYDLGKGVKFYKHRLVAELFIGEISQGMQVNHKDGDKGNNHVSNLEIVSAKENVKHMHDTGLSLNRRNHGAIYKKSDEVVLNAYLAVKMGWLGVAESAKKFDMPRTTLSSIMNKRTRCDVTDLVDSYFGFVN